MTWTIITGAGISTGTKFFGDATNKIDNMFNGVDILDEVEINPNVFWTYQGPSLRVESDVPPNKYIIAGGTLSGDVNLSIPDMTTDGEFIVTPNNSPITFNDNIKLFFGTGDDSSIVYDGTDMFINPKEVGVGILGILGDVDLNGNNLDNVLSYTSNAAIPSTVGAIKLGNTEIIAWRNAADNADLSLFANTNNELDISSFVAPSGHTRLKLGTNVGISEESNDLNLEVPNLNFIAMRINTVSTYTFSQSAITLAGNIDIVNAQSISSEGSEADAGFVRIANLQSVLWRNAANSANFGITGTAADTIQFSAPLDMVANSIFLDDSASVTFGTGNDATISYDGSDLLINPRAVGSTANVKITEGNIEMVQSGSDNGNILAINALTFTNNVFNPGAGVTYIADISGDFRLNTATGNNIDIRINNTSRLTVSGNFSRIDANYPLNMNSNLINSVTDPVSAQDAATKAYVDSFNELSELTDVTITSRAADEVLVVNAGNTAWVNAKLVNNNLASGVFGNITGLGAQTQDLEMGVNDIQFSTDGHFISAGPSNLTINAGNTGADVLRLHINAATRLQLSDTSLTSSVNLIFDDGKDILTNTTTGTRIATATTQKIAFYGSTPIVQPAALTAEDSTVINATYDATEEAVLNNVRTRVGEIESKLQSLGLLA